MSRDHKAVGGRRAGRVLVRCLDRLNGFLHQMMGVLLGLMVVLVAFQILVRSGLPKVGIVLSAPWTEELARYLMIWFIFLGTAVAARAGDLIAVEIAGKLLRNTWRKRLAMFALVVTICFFAVLFVLGLRWVDFGLSERSTVLRISMSWVYLALPVGSALSMLSLSARLYILSQPEEYVPAVSLKGNQETPGTTIPA